MSAVVDVDGWLYRLVQVAIREAVAARTLDEVLLAKSVLDAELRAYVRERLAETGIEVTELGVKDVILPGEIRELVNKVVEAGRTARASSAWSRRWGGSTSTPARVKVSTPS